MRSTTSKEVKLARSIITLFTISNDTLKTRRDNYSLTAIIKKPRYHQGFRGFLFAKFAVLVQIWCKLKNKRFFKAYNAVSCCTPFCVLVLEHFSLPFNLQATKIEMSCADSTHFFLFDGCSTFIFYNSISGSIPY